MPFGETSKDDPDDLSARDREPQSYAANEQEQTDRKASQTFIRAEHHLASALRGAEHRNQADALKTEGFDVLAHRLFDLSDALSCLEEFRDHPPKHYQASIEKILDGAEFIKALIGEYVQRENPRGGRLGTNEVLLELLLQLRRIAPERFPRELVNFTQEDFRALSISFERWIWGEVLRKARLAEFDPERFRRIFGPEYPPQRIVQERAHWAEIDRTNRETENRRAPNYTEAWRKIELALQAREPS